MSAPGGPAPEAEAQIRARSLEGDHAAAFQLAMSTYGDELLAFLRAFEPDDDGAREVFSDLSERLWKGLPGFRWECSFRTYAYLLARRASLHHREMRARRRQLSGDGDPAEVPSPGRSSTRPWLRTNVKDRFRALWTKLAVEEQQILMLRVDRQMSWSDVARVMDEDCPDKGAELAARAAALRQRFHGIKERLKALAREGGLITGDGP